MFQKKIIALDTLRIFFLLGVILFHTHTCFNTPGQNCPFLSFVYQYGGYFGNYFFFILSGVLVAGIYRDKIITRETDLVSYIKKKFFRIYPVYLIGEILAIYWLIRNANTLTVISIKQLITDSMLITSGWFWNNVPYNNPAWFICILMLCEVFYYFISYFTRKSDTVYISICLGMVLIGGILECCDLNFPFLYRINGEGYMNFFFGASLFSIYNAFQKKSSDNRSPFLLITALVLILVFLALFFRNNLFLHINRLIAISVICAISIAFTIFFFPVRRILELKPFCFLNNINLELYLFHMPLLGFYFELKYNLPFPEMKDGSYLVIYIIFVICLSMLIHYLVEFIRKVTLHR